MYNEEYYKQKKDAVQGRLQKNKDQFIQDVMIAAQRYNISFAELDADWNELVARENESKAQDEAMKPKTEIDNEKLAPESPPQAKSEEKIPPAQAQQSTNKPA